MFVLGQPLTASSFIGSLINVTKLDIFVPHLRSVFVRLTGFGDEFLKDKNFEKFKEFYISIIRIADVYTAHGMLKCV